MQVKFVRPVALLILGLISTLMIVTVQRAYATATVASASKTVYVIPAGGNSASFGIGTFNAPVSITVTQLTFNFRGVASATACYATETSPLMSWVGINSFQTSQTDVSLASGWVNTGGVVVLKVGWNGTSKLLTALDGSSNASRFLIHNYGAGPVTVVVEQIW